jgi:hypothetical protein
VTRDEKDRITALEVRMHGQDKVLKGIADDVRTVRDAMLRGEGSRGSHEKVSARVMAFIAALSSIFGGSIGAVLIKKFG